MNTLYAGHTSDLTVLGGAKSDVYHGFRGFKDLSPSLQDKIKTSFSVLKLTSLQAADFILDPQLPTPYDIDRLEDFLKRVNFGIVKFKTENPTTAYYYLSTLLAEIDELKRNDIVKRTDIDFSVHALRLEGEWFSAVAQVGDYTTGNKKAAQTEVLIDSHIKTMTGGVDLFADDLEISDDMIFLYRDKLPNAIVNLASFYGRSGEYEKSQILAKKGARVAYLLSSAQIQFDLVILQISSLLRNGKFDRGEIDEQIDIARKGIIVLATIYGDADKHITETARNQLRVLELFLATKRADLSNLTNIVKIGRERKNLMDSPNLDDDDRQKLLHIEIILHISYEGVKRDFEIMMSFKDKYPDDYKFLFDWQKKINDKKASHNAAQSGPSPYDGRRIDSYGFDLDEYLDKGNARLFLPPLVELFGHCTRSIVYNNGKGISEAEREGVFHMMVEIYRIAIGLGDVTESRKAFEKLAVFSEFIRHAQFFVFDRTGGNPMSSDELLDTIEKEIEERERRTNIRFERLLKSQIIEGARNIVSIEVVSLTGGVEHERINVYTKSNQSSTKASKTVSNESTVFTLGSREFKFYITTNNAPFNVEEIFGINVKLEMLLPDIIPHIQRKISRKKLETARKKWRHDYNAVVGDIEGLSSMVTMKAAAVRDETTRIMGMPGNPPPTVEALRRLVNGDIKFLASATGHITTALTKAQGLRDIMWDEALRATADDSEAQVALKKVDIVQVLKNLCSTDELARTGKIRNVLNLPSNKIELPVDIDYFGGIIGNFRQNAFRYRKPSDSTATMEISINEDATSVYLTFKDYGIGMSDELIEAYKGNKPFPTNTPRDSGSHLIGSKSIMDAVKAHKWEIDITSNYYESPERRYTSITIKIPKNQ